VAGGITLFIGSILLIKNWPKSAIRVKPAYEINSWRKVMVPFFIISMMFVLNNNIDILMLGSLSIPAEIGIFKISMQFAGLITFGLHAVRLVIAPRFSQYYAKSDFISLKRSAIKAARISFVFALPVCMILILWWRSIVIGFLKPEYIDSYLPLVILILGNFVSAFVGPVGVLLTMTKYEKDSVFAILFSLIINLVLNYLLIPSRGAIGAAVASAISSIFLNGILWIRVKHRFGFYIHPFSRNKTLSNKI